MGVAKGTGTKAFFNTVKMNGRPIPAPRGFNSVITGPAAIADCAASASTHT
jgi:hypothetical protein